MENKMDAKKTQGAWEIRVKQGNAGRSIGPGCSTACSGAISYPDNRENTPDGKED